MESANFCYFCLIEVANKMKDEQKFWRRAVHNMENEKSNLEYFKFVLNGVKTNHFE